MAKTIIITESQFDYITEGKLNEKSQNQEKDNGLFLKKMIKELHEFESKKNLMLERGAVAAFPYMGTLKNICKYIQQYIYNNKPTIDSTSNYTSWEFTIPKYLTRNIGFFKELIIDVTVYINPNGDRYSGHGGCTSYKNPSQYITTDGKWEIGKIFLFCCCDENRKLFERTFFHTAIHELNHKYEELKNALSDNSNRVFYDSATLRELAQKETFSYIPEVDKFIKDILYRLFSSSEANALVSATYGDLLSMNSERKNFIKDREELLPFNMYKYFKNNLYVLDYLSDDDWEHLRGFLDFYGQNISRASYGLESFKNKFYKKVNFCLKKIYNGIIRAAFLYYDNKDENKRTNIINQFGDSTITY